MLERLLICGVLGLVSGIVLRSFFVWGWPISTFFIVLAILFYSSYRLYRAHIYGYIAVFLLLLALGILRVHMVPQELPPEFASRAGTSVTLSGTVVSDPDIRETTQRVHLNVYEGTIHTKILAVLPLFPQVLYGDTMSVSGTLSLPEPFATDGGRSFDYPHFLAKDGVFAVLERASAVQEDRMVPIEMRVPRMLYAIRHTFAQGVSRAIPEPESSLAVGLLVGGKQGLGKVLLEAFTVSGLLPIIVLSGYNVMIVAEAILRSLQFAPKRIAIGIASVTILLFVLAAGGGASAVRAGIMAGVGLFSRATSRTYDALRALVFVLVLMLLMNPLLLIYDPGFQFSFMATLGLIIGAPLVEQYLGWVKSIVLREVLATTIAAQVFVLPLLLYETGNLSLVALPANVLVLPVIPLTMLLSFIAGIVGIVLPALAVYAGLPAYLLLAYSIGVATVSAGLPLAAFTIPSFPFLLVLVLYALLALLSYRLKRNTAHPRGALY